MHLGEFRGGDLAFQLLEQAAGSDRGELRGVTGKDELDAVLGRRALTSLDSRSLSSIPASSRTITVLGSSVEVPVFECW